MSDQYLRWISGYLENDWEEGEEKEITREPGMFACKYLVQSRKYLLLFYLPVVVLDRRKIT